MLICVYTDFQTLGARFFTCSSVIPYYDYEEFPEVLGLSLKNWNASGKIIFMIFVPLKKYFSQHWKEKITEVLCLSLDMVCLELMSH